MARKKELTNAEKVDKCLEDIKESCALIKKNIEYMNEIGEKLKKADEKLAKIEAKAKK
jgi:hypothetical protein